MHFEVLVEDSSGRAALDVLLPKILPGNDHSWRTIPYKGLGHIPKDLRASQDPAKRQLLAQLPRLIGGYGKSLPGAAVIVVVDLDRRDCLAFKRELLEVLWSQDPRPTALFRIAIEESEAWLLGDRPAVLVAYPDAHTTVLDGYVQDSICGTWEVLADAVRAGGSEALKREGWHAVGAAKHEWATCIAPHIDVARNRSRSFQTFCRGLRQLAGMPTHA